MISKSMLEKTLQTDALIVQSSKYSMKRGTISPYINELQLFYSIIITAFQAEFVQNGEKYE